MKLSSVYCCLLLAGISDFALADHDDTRRLLDENMRQTQQYRQSNWLQPDPDAVAENNALISINGQIYRVGDSEEELARGIYYALNFRQWDKMAQFLTRYRSLPAHKRELVLMSEALLARHNGDYHKALQSMRTAQDTAPDNVRIRLELARLLAEDNQNREAKAAFNAVLHQNLPVETQHMVQSYLSEIERRRHWHGSLSLGTGYSDNINQANGTRQCIAQFGDQCLAYRNLPKPVSSALFSYSAVASKTLPLRGNHHLHLRTLAHGTHYRRKDAQNPIAPDYGGHTAAVYVGYDYIDMRNRLSLSPYFEYDRRNSRTHYRVHGVDVSWTYNLNPNWQIGFNGGGKRFAYSGGNKKYFDNYTQYNIGVGMTQAVSTRTGWFVNLDFYRKKYPSALASNKETVLRAGVYRLFDNGIYLNALAQHRYSRHDTGSVMLTDGARRADRQTTFVLAVGARSWQYYDIYPELRLKHNRNRSNSVFYRHTQNEMTLNLKYSF